VGEIEKTITISVDSALKLKALKDVVVDSVEKYAGFEWLLKGPGAFIPIVGVEIIDTI